ncbi:MAG: hypothetical protein IJT18_00665 [Oscillospiraceae bacterium]|nr:hypothetical protein [Oscillospiraceae bacterium]
MEMDPIFAEAMLDEVQELLEAMLELAQRSIEDDCTDEERDDLQRQLETLRERIDETVDAYDRMGGYRDALYAAWKASEEIVRSVRQMNS